MLIFPLFLLQHIIYKKKKTGLRMRNCNFLPSGCWAQWAIEEWVIGRVIILIARVFVTGIVNYYLGALLNYRQGMKLVSGTVKYNAGRCGMGAIFYGICDTSGVAYLGSRTPRCVTDHLRGEGELNASLSSLRCCPLRATYHSVFGGAVCHCYVVTGLARLLKECHSTLSLPPPLPPPHPVLAQILRRSCWKWSSVFPVQPHEPELYFIPPLKIQ